jgi:hypothetical protein
VKRRRLDSKGGASEWASLDNIVSPVLPKEKKDEWKTQPLKGTSRLDTLAGNVRHQKVVADDEGFTVATNKKNRRLS